MLNVGSDFSGVGAFDQALRKLGLKYKTIFSCDMDLHARESYMANYGEPQYYPFDVYDRKIPNESLDIYMTSPPCQAFSLAGKRNGENDERGVLFYNSHEFIQKNQPRYFIFENVKGLLSDAKGRTFQIWLDMLGGKSINGNPVVFPRQDAVPYHIYYKVLNAKHYGVPQNRERVFIVGIRDDVDNTFNWPIPQILQKKLKDVLESDVDEKYFLSDQPIERISGDSGQEINQTLQQSISSVLCVGNVHPSGNGMNGQVYHENGIAPTLTTNKGEGIKIKFATKCGFEIATENDSINLSNPNSETRRGRVGKEVAQTLDTACNQGVLVASIGRSEEGKRLRREALKTGKDYTPFQAKEIKFKESDVMNCLTTATSKDNLILDQLNYKIRRLTPRECFRLMDFPDSFEFVCSNTQLYKQAGNSIVVNVLAQIINRLKF